MIVFNQKMGSNRIVLMFVLIKNTNEVVIEMVFIYQSIGSIYSQLVWIEEDGNDQFFIGVLSKLLG